MATALLWNLLLTAGLAVVLTVLCRVPSLRRRPALRHWLWLLLLAKAATPPLIPVPLLPAVADGDRATVIATPRNASMQERGLVLEPRDAAIAAVDRMDSMPVADRTTEVVLQRAAGDWRAFWLGSLLAVSLIGTSAVLTLHGVRGVRLHRWLKRAGTENSALTAACSDVASSLGFRGAVRSCVVDRQITPALWAWRRPVVVMPRQLLEELSPAELRGILAHELAHLVRRDHWANVFALSVKGLMWWNPVVWWADRELRAAQELCCDAIAIDRCNADRRGYATTLLKALEFVQAKPAPSCALAMGMGTRGSILRRFEMIGETPISYGLSRWALLALLVLAIPLLCIPVRAQEKGCVVPPTPPACDVGDENEETTEAEPTKTGNATEAIASRLKEAVAKAATEPSSAVDEIPGLDPKILELGEAVKKRMNAWTDEQTLTLKVGETGRMKIKENITPVAEILITPRFVEKETQLGLECVDAAGKKLAGTATVSLGAPDGQLRSDALGTTFRVNCENIMGMIQWKPTRQGDDGVVVEAKALFMRVPTPAELEAMQLTFGKRGRVGADLRKISYDLIGNYRNRTGHYPKNLAELNEPIPKDFYSPTGEDYRYELQRSRYILCSCGPDGIYGNDDDQMLVADRHKVQSGDRRSLYPLPPEKDEDMEDEPETAPQQTVTVNEGKDDKSPTETIVGVRPQGNCSISGKVVSAATGEPVENGRMYLHYNVTHGCIFVNTASDGTFVFKDLPKGPFSLQLSLSAGYQDVAYNPDDKPLPFPPFALEDGEQRSGIVLEARRACRISGKIRDQDGRIPENVNNIIVLAWYLRNDGRGYESHQARLNAADGSYLIDNLSNKPAYVMAIDWQAGREGRNRPPIYYPGVFSRTDAKQITFDEKPEVDNVDITLKTEGGITLEGTVVDEAGQPVPEAFVVAHRRDMLFDFVTAYTDEHGRYQIPCLGDGEFSVHVDAMHRGLVRTRTPLDLERDSTNVRQDFKLSRGVTISGKLVDENGNDWHIGESYGFAAIIVKDRPDSQGGGGFSLTRFWNKHHPKDVKCGAGGSFSLGEGDYLDGDMSFPTETTFILQGLMPGQTTLGFLPNKEGQKVLKILHDGQDVLESGFHTEAGQEVTDITIVIGAE